MPMPAATGPSTIASSSVSDTRALVRARCRSSTRRGGIDWMAGWENTDAMPCRKLSRARVRKSSAASRARDATTPRALANARVAFGPTRSITVPATGPNTIPGTVKAIPNSETSAAVASYS
jgi:hypothetical protein